jgi:uncharacterized repeat protein (TIGR03803 family)
LGVIFKLKTDGTGFTVLRSLTTADGTKPHGGFISVGDWLYGVTSAGGQWGGGTLFRIKTDGTSFQVLRSFHTANGDGIGAFGSLVAIGTTLFGTTLGNTDPDPWPDPGESQNGHLFSYDTLLAP